MTKAPAFQLYVKDWLSDPAVRMLTHSARGIWIDCVCLMWESDDRGRLSGTPSQLARLLSLSEDELTIFIEELKDTNAGTVTERNKKITLENRRMAREEKAKKSNAKRQARHRETRSNAKSNGEITPPSSSPSSSPSPKDKEKNPPPPVQGSGGSGAYTEEFLKFWEAYPKKKSKGQAFKTWKKLKREKSFPGLKAVLDAIAANKAGQDWQRDGGRFIPYPASWLNARGWEDVEGVELGAPRAASRELEQTRDWIAKHEKQGAMRVPPPKGNPFRTTEEKQDE